MDKEKQDGAMGQVIQIDEG